MFLDLGIGQPVLITACCGCETLPRLGGRHGSIPTSLDVAALAVLERCY